MPIEQTGSKDFGGRWLAGGYSVDGANPNTAYVRIAESVNERMTYQCGWFDNSCAQTTRWTAKLEKANPNVHIEVMLEVRNVSSWLVTRYGDHEVHCQYDTDGNLIYVNTKLLSVPSQSGRGSTDIHLATDVVEGALRDPSGKSTSFRWQDGASNANGGLTKKDGVLVPREGDSWSPTFENDEVLITVNSDTGPDWLNIDVFELPHVNLCISVPFPTRIPIDLAMMYALRSPSSYALEAAVYIATHCRAFRYDPLDGALDDMG